MIGKFGILTALLPVLYAAALTGTYQASFDLPNGDKRQMTFAFVDQGGGKLSGYISSPQGSLPIVESLVTGDRISFAVERDSAVDVEKVTYTGRVNGDSIAITMAGSGDRPGREVTAVRVSSRKRLSRFRRRSPKSRFPPLQPVP